MISFKQFSSYLFSKNNTLFNPEKSKIYMVTLKINLKTYSIFIYLLEYGQTTNRLLHK